MVLVLHVNTHIYTHTLTHTHTHTTKALISIQVWRFVRFKNGFDEINHNLTKGRMDGRLMDSWMKRGSEKWTCESVVFILLILQPIFVFIIFNLSPTFHLSYKITRTLTLFISPLPPCFSSFSIFHPLPLQLPYIHYVLFIFFITLPSFSLSLSFSTSSSPIQRKWQGSWGSLFRSFLRNDGDIKEGGFGKRRLEAEKKNRNTKSPMSVWLIIPLNSVHVALYCEEILIIGVSGVASLSPC